MERAGSRPETEAFGKEAKYYDSRFSTSEIGSYQRALVWHWFHKHINNAHLSILEINGGTGVDAQHFTEKGHPITCTDAAEEMVAIAASRGVKAQIWDLNQPVPDNIYNEKYDIIFSNFSGLNCLSPERLTTLASSLSSLLTAEGKLVVVIFGRYCIWEWLYFLVTGKWKQLRRRQRGTATAGMQGKDFTVWYYSRRMLQTALTPYFRLHRSYPIGVLLPPSYLWCQNNWSAFLKGAFRIDTFLGAIGWPAFAADHTMLFFDKQEGA